jgi:hypothetical protein
MSEIDPSGRPGTEEGGALPPPPLRSPGGVEDSGESTAITESGAVELLTDLFYAWGDFEGGTPLAQAVIDTLREKGWGPR